MTAHDPDRRATLVRALVEIVADRGLDAVSVREVAAHANVSIGAVQHHFRTKSAMLRAAMDDVARRWAADVEKDTESAEPDTALRHLLHKLVPTTPTDEDARVWLAFVARAAVDPDLATVHSEGMARLEEALVRGALTHGVDPAHRQRIADELAAAMALVDGLTVAVLLEPKRMTPERAHAIVDAHVDRLLGG